MQCARENLRMFIGHEEQVDPAKEGIPAGPCDESEFIKQAKSWLSFEHFSSLHAWVVK